MSDKFPSRLDLIVLLAIPVWTVSILASIFWFSDDGSTDPHLLILPMLTGLGAATVAMGAAIGSFRWNPKACLALMFLFAISILIFFCAGPLLTHSIPRHINGSFPPTRQYAFGERTNFEFACNATITIGICFLVGLFSVIAFRVGWKFARHLGKRFSMNRVKGLLAIACFLLTIHFSYSVADFFGWTPDGQTTGYYVGMTFIISCYVLMFGAAIYLPLLFCQTRLSVRVKFSLAMLISIGCAIGAVFGGWSGMLIDQFSWWATYASVAPCFLVSLIAVARPKHGSVELVGLDSDATTVVPSQQASADRLRVSRIAIGICLAMTIAASGFLYLFEPALLFRNRVSISDAFKMAEFARTISRKSQGAITVMTSQGQPFFWTRIRDERDLDCLDLVREIDPELLAFFFVIEGLNPAVDTSALAEISKGISLVNGEVSSKQLADLSSQCFMIGVINTKLPEGFDGSYAVPAIALISTQNAPVDRFVKSHMSGETPVPWMSVTGPINEDEWNAIASANITLVRFHGLPPAEVLSRVPAPATSYKHIELFFADDPFENPKLLRFLVNTDVQFQGHLLMGKKEADLALATGRMRSGIRRLPEAASEAFIALAKENNRSYAWDAHGNITEIWLPNSPDGVVNHAKLFTELKVLRTDLRGIVCENGGATMLSQQVMHWKLPKLERLYLPSGIAYEELTFLGAYPKLIYLQIQSQDRTVQRGRGFELCVNLEKLVIFGTPDKKSWAELRMLKKLKDLVLVDDDGDFPLPADVAKAESQLPGVNIDIVQPTDYQADISGAFKKHIEAIRERLTNLANGDSPQE